MSIRPAFANVKPSDRTIRAIDCVSQSFREIGVPKDRVETGCHLVLSQPLQIPGNESRIPLCARLRNVQGGDIPDTAADHAIVIECRSDDSPVLTVPPPSPQKFAMRRNVDLEAWRPNVIGTFALRSTCGSTSQISSSPPTTRANSPLTFLHHGHSAQCLRTPQSGNHTNHLQRVILV